MDGDGITLAILSDELWLKIFDSLSLIELLRASRVCREWRELALSHTKYWKWIAIQSLEDGAVRTFLARLAKSYGRPISVEIQLGMYSSDNPPETTRDSEIYSGLRQHLHHVEWLMIRHWEAADPNGILQALRRPAPVLRYLDLWLGSTEDVSSYQLPVLPSDVFSGEVGPITALHLNGVSLPVDAPAWFSGVTELSLVYVSTDAYVLSCLPAFFPRLARLRLAGNMIIAHPAEQNHAFWQRLELLRLEHGEVCHRWQPWAPYLARIRELKISRADDAVVDLFAHHLDGYLDFDLRAGMWSFSATLTSQSSGLVRVVHNIRDTRQFAGHPGTWDGHAPPQHSLFESHLIVDRVTLLTVAAVTWNDFVGYFASLPVLAQLRIVSGSDDPIFDISKLRLDRCLRCPRLGSLSLHTHRPREEETRVIAVFLKHGLQREPAPLALQFTAFELKGPLDVFESDIRVSVGGLVLRDIEQPFTNPPISSV